MTETAGSRSLRARSRGVLPIIAAVAILLIMVGAIIIILLGGSVSIQYSFP